MTATTRREIVTEAYRQFRVTMFLVSGKPAMDAIIALADEQDGGIPSHWTLKETCDHDTRGWLEWSSEEPITDEEMERVRLIVQEIDNAVAKIRSKA